MKLYKYMSTNAGKEFFNIPSLRLTPAFCLNDPFELSIPSSVLNNISKKGGNPDEANNFMKLHGIVSLTESYSNLLMWSHYAGDHSGVVVEFDFESKSPLSLFNSYEPPPSSDVLFGHVDYNKKRSRFNLPSRSLRNVMKPYYFKKSNDWKYEKEYRFVLPLTHGQ